MSLILNLNRERLDVDVFPDDAGASTTLVERFVKADVAAPPQSNLI